jgi:hypothetical protein
MKGFFGMNFFTLTDDHELKVNKYLYLFFLITFPVTWACLKWLSRTESKILEGSSETSWYQKFVEGLPSLFTYLQYRTQIDRRHAIESSSVSSQTSDIASQVDGRTSSDSNGLTNAATTGPKSLRT